MQSINIKTSKKCAICKYWYDPTYTAIYPKAPQINLWEIDERINKICLQKGMEMSALGNCSKFVCKLEII